jgi:UDP-galactopyranose mutase
MYKVVIARYNENIDWINNYCDKHKFIIINNGENNINFDNIINRENTGRDPGCYLYYIINNYHNLSKYTIFLQADPFPHMYGINQLNIQDKINILVENMKDNEIAKPVFANLINETSGTPYKMKTDKYYSYFFEGFNNIMVFSAGMQYIVPRENILLRPIDFYIKMYNMLINSKHTLHEATNIDQDFDTNIIDPWCLERLFLYSFSKDIKISQKIKLDIINSFDYLIIGCGLSGVVLAERIANDLNKKVVIIEKSNHIGGNCYDFIEPKSNILVNKYGVHIFHTDNKEVWDYVNKFDKWVRWEHKVMSYVDNMYVSVPINITTVNQLCNETIQTENEMNEWLSNNQVKYNAIDNSEKMAKSRIGEILYNKIIKNYTFKQWNKYPEELNEEVLKRIPVYNNFDTRYFKNKYQALPHKGYTHFFNKILDNPLITVFTETDYNNIKKDINLKNFKSVIYTGPIDKYFEEYNLEKLEYRSIDFKMEVIENMNYYQPCANVNYPDLIYPYTRIIEYKHLLNQKSKDTVIISETTNDTGEPYYPVLTNKNLELYNKYKELAEKEELNNNVFFVGRLANYKYFDMDTAIENSLNIYKKIKNL